METFTLGLRSSWRIRAFGRNPLVRTSDRVEVLALAMVLLILVFAVPIAGSIGTAVYESRARLYTAEEQDRNLISATLSEDAAKRPRAAVAVEDVTATAVWRVGEVERVGAVPVSSGAKIGDPVEVWVDRNGDQVAAPTPVQQAALDALIIGAGSWFAVAGAVAVLWAGLSVVLTRHRANAWARQWELLVDNNGLTS